MLRFVVFLAALVVAPSAAAQASRSLVDAIDVTPRDDACIQARSLADRVAVLIGTGELDAAIAIDVSVRSASELSFVVRRQGEEIAQRSFDVLPIACESRVAAVSLALALAIDHVLLERMAREEPPPPPPSGVRLALDVDAVVALAILHEPAFGGAIAAELSLDPIASLRVRAMTVYSPRASVGDGHFESVLGAAQLAGCLGYGVSRVALGGCAGVAVGFFRAAGTDFAINLETLAPWVALSLEAFLTVILESPVAIRVGVEGDVSLLVPTVTIVNRTGAVVDRAVASPVGSTVSVGVVYRL